MGSVCFTVSPRPEDPRPSSRIDTRLPHLGAVLSLIFLSLNPIFPEWKQNNFQDGSAHPGQQCTLHRSSLLTQSLACFSGLSRTDPQRNREGSSPAFELSASALREPHQVAALSLPRRTWRRWQPAPSVASFMDLLQLPTSNFTKESEEEKKRN